MLYYDFKNYEEFKQIFGIIEHGNGVKSRNNKILLALYKDRRALRMHIRHKAYTSWKEYKEHLDVRFSNFPRTEGRGFVRLLDLQMMCIDKMSSFSRNEKAFDLLECKSLPVLKNKLLQILSGRGMYAQGCYNKLMLNHREYYSDKYKTDDMDGLCEDGTLNAIRYYNIEKERVFKMKAGKMFNHILQCNLITRDLPEQIHRWLGEEFVADWTEYARENIGDTEYKLHVDDNFEDIYTKSCCAGYDVDPDSFGSCMMDDDQWTFYRDAVKAKAAYLTDSYGKIVARCIIFTDVHERDSDKVWRLAERQYSKACDPSLKRQLVCSLIRGGHIDGYKRVGSSCHDSRAYVDNEGNSLEDKQFWIDCNLHSGDTLSYQDSFKNYDEDNEVADNYSCCGSDLDVTDRTFHGEDEEDEGDYEYSSWNDENIPSDEACYVDSRNDWFWNSQVVYAYVYDSCSYDREDCFEEDCIEIDGDYYYAGCNAEEPENYGIYRCPYCDEYFVPGIGNSSYSEVTQEDYCCSECREETEKDWYKSNGWVYSEYDEEWYEDAEDVITVYEYMFRSFCKTTISVESFNGLAEVYRATEYRGSYYLDKVNHDGEPVHACCGQHIAA